MTKNFDLIVIGTGAAASTVAYKCRSAGWQVAVIDSRPFGGTCALRGCDPKKVLAGAAEAVDWVRRMSRELGLEVQLRAEVVAVEKGSGQLAVRASASGKRRTFEADMVVQAVGRIPEIDDMNLDRAGVAWDGRGVKVNEF